ncbi:Glycerol-3-phosphate ABC transporter, ATP-binding protein UgpC [Candidatus Rhodobacter oscarellae]|uniref:Glycerol-3-phosphate ABC transporter, ATP-binding protein UgpC n=2 Tax=Candidatus Rhodobacter oscarellae TaxID=1675527 RepID=A0A0J9H338_9RHOB|nr:Glycerol-3-phosphate ABC transporter, ATP-binding protein UgpC [Candidatus Rhodobacter lobularis]
MVRAPVAFLMDEPLSNLDAALRVHMRAELSELHRRLSATFVYVTHDQAEALTMSDRMAVMMDGRILQVGPPYAIYADPNCLEVAQFIGSPAINTLPAEIDAEGQLTVLGRRLGTFRAAPGPVTVGVRPEHLSLGASGGFVGTVRHRENLGSDLYLHLDLEGLERVLVLRTSPGASARIGDQARFSIDPDAALLFGPHGRRLYAPIVTREIA